MRALSLAPLLTLSLGCSSSGKDNPFFGVYFVKLDKPAEEVVDTVDTLANELGLEVLNVYDGVSEGFSVYIPHALADELRRVEGVKYVKEDSKEGRIPTDEPNPDLVLGEDEIPVGMARIGAPYTGSADLTAIHVAVVDTGVQASHSELNVVAEEDVVCVSSDDCADGTDPQGHGTHVAGTIGARGDGEGVVGVAPGVPIHAVRVLGSDGSGYMTDIIAGLEYVYDTPEIRVVNMSLGGPARSGMDEELEEAVLRLEEAGVFVAIAAGNETQDTDNVIPAAFDLGIVVSAYDTSDGDKGFARFSNFGEQVDIAAPGVDIFSTWPDGGYAALSGTSMATPHVAGAAAAYLARFPDTSPASLRARMIETAEGDLTGANERHSEGLLDFEALNDR